MKPSYDGKIISFVEVESLCGATGYPLRTPRLEDTVLVAYTREPITVTTERYLGVLRFCRWSQAGHNQKLAQFISEIRVERSHTRCSVQIITKSTQLDNNSECDPLPSFALARDRAEGLEIFL